MSTRVLFPTFFAMLNVFLEKQHAGWAPKTVDASSLGTHCSITVLSIPDKK